MYLLHRHAVGKQRRLQRVLDSPGRTLERLLHHIGLERGRQRIFYI